MSATPQASAGKAAGWGWAVPAFLILALICLAMLFGGPERPRNERGTSYDASGHGFRAAYLLLEDLGYPVTRGRRAPGGRGVRFVLFSNTVDKADVLDDWVRRGGLLVLAEDSAALGHALDMSLMVRELDSGERVEKATGGGIHNLAGGSTFVDRPAKAGEVWCSAGGRPAITIYHHGDGEIWLLNRPEFLTNRELKKGDNAVLLCRLASEVLERRPGELVFDEYYHGLRDRPGFFTLLFQPPAVWITAQALVLLAILLWHYVPRFGALRIPPPLRRRSRDEFLDAMAALLERKGDFGDAYRTTRNALVRDLERELGLPAGATRKQLLAEALRGRPADLPALTRALRARRLPAEAGKRDFVEALNNLEKARHEFFERRQHHR